MKRLVSVLAIVGAVCLGWSVPAGAVSRTVPVLGSSHYAPYSEGFGHAHPHKIFNGGDPAGTAFALHWRHWGSATSVASGKTYLNKPGGGYYARPGKILLRARMIGSCGEGRRAYVRLSYRAASHPGGPVSRRWRAWGETPGSTCSYL